MPSHAGSNRRTAVNRPDGIMVLAVLIANAVAPRPDDHSNPSHEIPIVDSFEERPNTTSLNSLRCVGAILPKPDSFVFANFNADGMFVLRLVLRFFTCTTQPQEPMSEAVYRHLNQFSIWLSGGSGGGLAQVSKIRPAEEWAANQGRCITVKGTESNCAANSPDAQLTNELSLPLVLDDSFVGSPRIEVRRGSGLEEDAVLAATFRITLRSTIAFHIGHDASVAVLADHDVLAVLELERMTGVRYYEAPSTLVQAAAFVEAMEPAIDAVKRTF